MQIKVKTPAKINLTLEITGKRPDGFHNIRSVMQMINLYDILTININRQDRFKINLSGNNTNIPYDDKNIVYKAIVAFTDYTHLKDYRFDIYIDKHIFTEAGLAGGSSNAAGTLLALNELFETSLTSEELHKIASTLGSDLNVILMGGCTLAEGRGEKVTPVTFREYPVSLIKPNNLGISAKEGYQKYSSLKDKPQNNYTDKVINALKNNEDIKPFLYNDLETAVFKDYNILQKIKSKNPKSIMSGSGSTYFVLDNTINNVENCTVVNGLKTINKGCDFIE